MLNFSFPDFHVSSHRLRSGRLRPSGSCVELFQSSVETKTLFSFIFNLLKNKHVNFDKTCLPLIKSETLLSERKCTGSLI